MLNDVLQWISQYGYFGIFVLMLLGILPLPDVTILIFSGYLTTLGGLRFDLMLLSAAAGAIAGVTLNYALGRYLGYELLRRHGRWVGCDDEKLRKLHEWYDKYGGWTLVFGYYVPAIRQLAALVAGTSRMFFPRFMLWAYPAVVIWAVIFVTLGRQMGEHWREAVATANRHASLLTIALLVAVGLYVLYRIWRRRSR